MTLLALLFCIAAPQRQDTVLVRSTEPAAWAASLPLRPALRLGTLDGPPEYSFGSIDQLAATEAGTFVTYDGSDTQLRRYDATGKFLGLIGRAGAGPGEYRTVEGLLYLGDSLLAVWDPPNQRVSLFAASGEYRRTIPVPGGIFGGDRPLLPAPQGHFLIRVARPGATRETAFRSQYLEFDASGRVMDTLPDLAGHQEDGHFVLMASDGPRWDFPVESLYARTPGGELVRGHSNELGFSVQLRGGAERHVTRPARALPLTGAERKQWEDWRAFFAEQAHRVAQPLPTVKPLARSLNVDPAGRVWVEVYAEATARPPKPRPPGDKRPQFVLRDASTYEVFTLGGRYLGRIAMDPESTILAATASRLFVLGHGPDGEEQIVTYLFPPTPR